MKTLPLRIGCVPYLNAKPLLEGLDGVLLKPPSDLVGELVSGRLDVALLPAVEVILRGLAHVPGISIAARGKVDSVLLRHRVPLPEIRRVALDRNSRTSNMLCRILLEERHGLKPDYVVRDPSRRLDWRGVDAVLTIGDTSFRREDAPALDLAEDWLAFTGKPFVFALWAHRPGHPRAREIGRTLRAARDLGLSRIGAVARREAARLGISPAYARRYLVDRIRFGLGPGERAGLRRFARLVHERA